MMRSSEGKFPLLLHDVAEPRGQLKTTVYLASRHYFPHREITRSSESLSNLLNLISPGLFNIKLSSPSLLCRMTSQGSPMVPFTVHCIRAQISWAPTLYAKVVFPLKFPCSFFQSRLSWAQKSSLNIPTTCHPRNVINLDRLWSVLHLACKQL